MFCKNYNNIEPGTGQTRGWNRGQLWGPGLDPGLLVRQNVKLISVHIICSIQKFRMVFSVFSIILIFTLPYCNRE